MLHSNKLELKNVKFILASTSPRRRELVHLVVGLSNQIKNCSPDFDESKHPPNHDLQESIEKYVERLSQMKAEAALNLLATGSDQDNKIIIAADTMIGIDNDIIGKPKNKDEAKRILTRLSGRNHQVSTGVCILAVNRNGTVIDRVVFHESTNVKFSELSSETILRYIDTLEPLDKAGAYGIQGYGACLIEKINGDYFNVVGLPIHKLSLNLAGMLDRLD